MNRAALLPAAPADLDPLPAPAVLPAALVPVDLDLLPADRADPEDLPAGPPVAVAPVGLPADCLEAGPAAPLPAILALLLEGAALPLTADRVVPPLADAAGLPAVADLADHPPEGAADLALPAPAAPLVLGRRKTPSGTMTKKRKTAKPRRAERRMPAGALPSQAAVPLVTRSR